MAKDSLEYFWRENLTHVCYEEELAGVTTTNSFCGQRDNCTGTALPLVLEITWSREFRAVLYFVGLIYRCVVQYKVYQMTQMTMTNDAIKKVTIRVKSII